MGYNLDTNNGWQEAVIMVSDLERIPSDLVTVGGWVEIAEGAIDEAQLKIWGLSNAVSGSFKLMGNPNSDKGLIRFIKLDGIDQKQIRPAGQIWENGGIFDLNLRVTDINKKFTELLDRGWSAYNEPVEYKFGPVTVSEVLMTGPDGVLIALIERIDPPLDPEDTNYEISKVFNSSLIVDDIEKHRVFFEETLGFGKAMEVLGHSLPEGPNVLGLPDNIIPNHAMNVYIFQENGVADGSIEMLKLDGLKGRDFSGNAKPYNLGITSLRHPISDVDSMVANLKAKNLPPIYEPEIIDIAPYGKIKIFAIDLPEGGWLEFFEVL